jgi:U3 small nucleolar RNA-associated protein 22
MTALGIHAANASAGDIIAKDAALLDSIDLSSTMDLHRSNLMRMQVTELLEECQLDLKGRKWTIEAHEYLQDVTKLVSQAAKQHFMASSSSKSKKEETPFSIKDRADKVVHIEKLAATSSKKNSAGITIEPIGCTKSQFGWTKKSGNAQMLPTFSLMVKLPVEFFSSKDYLKYRYFDVREQNDDPSDSSNLKFAFFTNKTFLSSLLPPPFQKRNFIADKIAVHLANHTDKLGSVEFKWSKGSSRAPYLQLVPNPSSSSKRNKKKGAKFQVHLHFGMQSIDWIPQLRLVPNRCNIRDSDDGRPSDPKIKLIQSQLYNQSLLFDARHHFEDEHLTSEELVDHPNVEATLVLIQIWALQRGLWRNHDGWSRENVVIFLLYVLRTNRMNPRMTPIQQFTVVLQMWSTTNWLGTSTSKGKSGNDREVRASQSEASQYSESKRYRRDVLVLPEEDSSEKETIRNSDLARLYEKATKESPLTNKDPSTLIEAYASGEHYSLGPVMLDSTMTYNFLGDVSPNFMKLLQNHATKSLQGLKESSSAFSNMFMKNARFWTQWDMYVKIPLRKKSGEWEPTIRCLLGKLELALGNRIRGMRVMSTGNGDVSLENNDLDQIPSNIIDKNSTYKQRSLYLSPTYSGEVILGIAINPETSQRVVDRGPPSDQQRSVQSFVQLWGDKAELRRFKDGAIVQAVVWNDNDGKDYYQNQIKLQGGYVDKILGHIVRLHYTKENIEFALPNLISIVDGISTHTKQVSTQLGDPIVAHQHVMKAFEALSECLRQGTQPSHYRQKKQVVLELPLTIDAVEPLSSCLRYSELFPPIPHPFLGGMSASNTKQVSGAIMSHPVLIQIRFGATSKWPSDLKAIGAAKTAMLIQLANSIEAANSRDFDGPIQVTPNYLDLGYRGYCFRIFVRADPEIKMLQGLVRPSRVASSLLKTLTRVHVIAAKHHSMIHAVHTSHPSSAGVVRMAKRWVANHMLSGLVTTEALELMVAKVYSDNETPLETPSTVTAGFLRFLYLLAHHDWLG